MVWPDGRCGGTVVAGVLVVDLEDAACVGASQADDALCIGSSTLMVLESATTARRLSTHRGIDNGRDRLGGFCRKSSIGSIVLGLSGGIDSAVALASLLKRLVRERHWAGDAKSSFLATLH